MNFYIACSNVGHSCYITCQGNSVYVGYTVGGVVVGMVVGKIVARTLSQCTYTTQKHKTEKGCSLCQCGKDIFHKIKIWLLNNKICHSGQLRSWISCVRRPKAPTNRMFLGSFCSQGW